MDLAALSMSGSLMPSVPVQLMLKFDPPKISLVYHFEHKEQDKFFHDIALERRMLETMSDEDLASHLYVTEAYYFNPKQIKRQQILKLIRKLKEGMETHSKQKEERRKNFFQRKRFVNYEMNAGVGHNEPEDSDNEGGIAPNSNHKQKVVEFEEDPVISGHQGNRPRANNSNHGSQSSPDTATQ